MEARPTEKRRTGRSPCFVDIKLTALESAEQEAPNLPRIEAVSENICLGGVGVLSEHSFSPSAVVRAEFSISGSPVPVPTLMKVQWVRQVQVDLNTRYRVGLQFLV
jgi:hypothetical protein